MIGKVRTQEQCPKCGGEFKDTLKELKCPDCLTTPRNYFVDWYYKKRIKRYGFQSYGECINFLVEITNKIKEKRYDPRDYETKNSKFFRFDYFIDRWLSSRQKEVEKQKIAPSYFVKLKKYVSMFLEHFKSDDIREVFKTHRINDFYESLPSHLALKTQRNIMDCLRKIVNDAIDQELITVKPKFPKIIAPKPIIPTIDVETQDQVMQQIPEEHRPFIYIMARLGVRPAEARALQWEDVDFKKDIICIRRTFSLNTLRKITKQKKAEQIPFTTDIKEMFLSLPRSLMNNFVFTKKGKPYSESYARKLWNAACEKLGIKGVYLYAGTKHSVGDQWVNDLGESRDTLAGLFRHSNVSMTERYSRVKVETVRKILELNRHSTDTLFKQKAQLVGNENSK